jgi:hypothetical protein
MTVIPEELIDRVSLDPNTLPTEAEARDGVQATSEHNVSEQPQTWMAIWFELALQFAEPRARARGTDVSILGRAQGQDPTAVAPYYLLVDAACGGIRHKERTAQNGPATLYAKSSCDVRTAPVRSESRSIDGTQLPCVGVGPGTHHRTGCPSRSSTRVTGLCQLN